MSAMRWAEQHPWMTFFLASAAIGGVSRALARPTALDGFGNEIFFTDEQRAQARAREALVKGGSIFDAITGGGSISINPGAGTIDIHGNPPIGPPPPPTGLDGAWAWAKDNPVLAAGAVGAGILLWRRR